MDEFISRPAADAGNSAPNVEFYLGTVKAWNQTDGMQIQLDGQSEPMQKRYNIMYVCRPLKIGTRVIVMKISGSYIVLGEYGKPIGFYRPETLSSNASLADVINVVNMILSALRSQGLVWNPQ